MSDLSNLPYADGITPDMVITVLGLIPLYVSGGEMWEGMAVSIMIGLLFGTVITLLFIPSLYSILFKVNYKDYKFDDAILEA